MNEGILDLGEMLLSLDSIWSPHSGQVDPGRALFYDKIKNIFICAGRNWGKTEFIAYAVTRWAMQYENSENYIFEPLQKQAKEILWVSGRLQKMIPPEWIDGEPNNTEMRIRLVNGSFIKLDGSDNFDAYRGVKPKGLSIYDELKDHKKAFLDAYEPNRAAYDSPAIFVGTPPEFHNHFVELMELSKKSKHWKFFQEPTSANPYISKEWLERKREELIMMNDEETWLREYEAIYVKGGKRHIYPQAVKYKPAKKEALTERINIKHWDLIITFDPAASSTFAVLFAAFNQYTRQTFIFDEIYEQDQGLMTVKEIWNAVSSKLESFKRQGFKNIRYIYDEAESWFMNETSEREDTKAIWLEPTRKATNDKEFGITLVRELFNKGLIEIADTCVKTLWEFENYMKDEQGRIPKKNDHLLDCLRYHCHAVGYNIEEVPPPKDPDLKLEKRFTPIEEEFSLNSLKEFDMSEDYGSYEEI